MKIDWHNVILKSVPYILSIAGGAVLFWISNNYTGDENVNDLIDNMSASLLSIPLVFLLYDYANYRISRRINKTLAENMSERVDGLIMNLAVVLGSALGARQNVNMKYIHQIAGMTTTEISRRMKITGAVVSQLRAAHHELEDFIYKNARANILTLDQANILTNLARESQRLINLHLFRQDSHSAAKYVKNIFLQLADWLDSDIAPNSADQYSPPQMAGK